MSQTLPADLYIPQLFAETVAYKFYENLSLWTKFAGGGGPIDLNLSVDLILGGGRYIDRPVFKPISSFMSRRDLTSEADATPAKVEYRNDNTVRCSSKAIVSWTQSAEWINKVSPAQFTTFIAGEFANRMWLYVRNFWLAACNAAISNMTTSLHDLNVWSASVRTNLSANLLARCKALLADRAGDFFNPGSGAGWVFRSESFFTDLVTGQLASGTQGIADYVAGTGFPLTLGLDYVLADDAALTVADAGFDKYISLLLGKSCGFINILPASIQMPWMNPKAENVEFVWRGDFDFEIGFPGFQWDKTNGGANPTLANIGTASNWDPTYSDHREVAMARIIHNYSGN